MSLLRWNAHDTQAINQDIRRKIISFVNVRCDSDIRSLTRIDPGLPLGGALLNTKLGNAFNHGLGHAADVLDLFDYLN